MRMGLWGTAALALTAAAPAAALDCAGLAGVVLPNAQVTAAAIVPAGTPPLKPAADLCRVAVTAHPSADSDVRVELWIPQGQAWNGRFLQVGNGGFAGSMPYRLLTLGTAGGFASAGTDDGHQADGRDGKWALGHPEKIVDFGTRAVKTTTDIAKALLTAYAGKAPPKSYFFGCSDGGREALMTAQRYPADFDGIVAGAPAYAWTSLQAAGGLFGKALADPARRLPPAKLAALQTAALGACGNGKAWIADPQACRFDPGVLACKGTATAACLTPGELQTVRLAYGGMRNPATGEQLPGLKPGAEAAGANGWEGWGVGGGDATADDHGFAHDHFAYFVRQTPDFKLRDLTTADLAKSERDMAPLLNATSPDLSAFKARGGKLIQYHGWNDPAISPEYSLRYAAAVTKKMGDASDFYRLYMVPGMLHCTGGASPFQADWLKPLVAWVEGGTAPQTITAYGAGGASQTLIPQGSARR